MQLQGYFSKEAKDLTFKIVLKNLAKFNLFLVSQVSDIFRDKNYSSHHFL